MRRMNGLLLTGLLLAGLLLAMLGCTTRDAEDLSGPTTTESQGRSEDRAGGPGTASAPNDDHGDDDGDDDVFDNLEDCVELSRAYLALAVAPAALALAGDEAVEEFEEEIDDIEDEFPGELRDDFETVAEAYRAYALAIKDAGGNIGDPGVRQQLEDAQGELDNPEVQAANERIQNYFTDTCQGE